MSSLVQNNRLGYKIYILSVTENLWQATFRLLEQYFLDPYSHKDISF